MNNIYVLYNVDANVHKSTGILNATEQYLREKGVEHKTLISKSRKEASDFIHELEAVGGGTLIIIGGDGTIHNAVNSITDFDKVKVGFIRGGSGNDLCQTLGINKDPVQAIDDIMTAEESTMDLIDVSGVKCVNVAATGLDIEVLRQRDRMKLFKGNFKYKVATLITLLRFGSYKLNIKRDGEENTQNAMLVAVGNGKYFGGGMMAVPHASPFSGRIALTVVNEVKKYQMPKHLPNFMKGTHEKSPKLIFHYDVDSLEVSAPEEKDFTIDIDGELYPNLPFVCKPLPNKLKVFLPKVGE